MDKLIALAITAASCLVTITVYISYTRFKADQLAKDNKETNRRLDEAVSDLQGVTVQLATITKEQAVINVKVTEALAGIIHRLERLSDRSEEHGRDIAVLKDRADG